MENSGEVRGALDPEVLYTGAVKQASNSGNETLRSLFRRLCMCYVSSLDPHVTETAEFVVLQLPTCYS